MRKRYKTVLILLVYLVSVINEISSQKVCPGHESLLVGPQVCVWRCKGSDGHCGYGGKCQSNGECLCTESYLQQTSNKLLCMPKCLAGCRNEEDIKCIAKQFCDCGPEATFDRFHKNCSARGDFDVCPG